MRAAALRLIKADLTARPGQTVLTAVAIFAAATALVVTLSLRAGLDDPFQAALDQTRGAHVAVFGELTDEELATLIHLPGVEQAEVRTRTRTTTKINGANAEVGLETLPRPDAAVDRPKLTDGRRPSSLTEVLVERSFARQVGLTPGATLELGGRTATVTGLAVTTEQASYPRWDPGIVWASNVPGTSRRVGVRLTDPDAIDAFKVQAQRALPTQRLQFSDWTEVRNTITDQTRTNSIVISVNTLLALLVVGFTVATVISGRVLAQRREIGLLKAVGFAPRNIVALLVAEYLAIAIAASVLGLIAGAAISPLLLKPMSSLLATPTPSALAPLPLIGALLLILVAVAIFTAVPALKAGRVNTVDALALGRTGGANAPSKAARLAAALKLPATARLGVKDAFTSRSRASLTVGALALMVITLVAALSVEATYHKVIDDPALRAKPYDLRVESADALQTVEQDPAVERATTLTGLQVTGPRGREIHARAIGEGFEHFAYAVPDGRMFARPGEAIAGRGLFDTLGLQVGDSITVRISGEPTTLKLVGRHVEPDNDGEVLIFPAVRPGGSVIAQLKPGADAHAVKSRLERATGAAAEVTADAVRVERADIRPILLGSTLLLVAVGLVNLLATLLLVTRERARDFAIFKAMGLTPRGVLAVVNAGGAALGAIAVVIGIPAGLIIFREIMRAMSPSEGTDIVGLPGPFALALTIPFVLAVSALASSVPGRRAATASAAATLRAE
jgi:putative ABC transport system permease protein